MTLMGLVIGIGITWLALGSDARPKTAEGQRVTERDRGFRAGGELFAIQGSAIDGQQLIVLIDPQERTLGSYLVDTRSGQIALRSVRNIRWDLQLETFNGTEPTPEKIQALLQPR